MLALAAGALASFGLGLSAAPAAAADLPGAFKGDAYATYANAKAGQAAVTLGRSAYIGCNCAGTKGQLQSNTVSSLSAGDNGKVLKAATLTNTVLTTKTSTTATVKTTSTISGVNILNGLITADAIKAVTITTATASAITHNFLNSTFGNLKIGGVAIAANVDPHERINLPGLGYVVLRKFTRTTDTLVMDMITIEVTTANSFGLDIGAKIIVGHSSSGYLRTVPYASVAGLAIGSSANAKIGSNLQNRIGESAPSYVPNCIGTGGRTTTESAVRTDIGGVAQLGVATTTAYGLPSATSAVAKTTSTVTSVSLLNGLVKASTIVAVAQATYQGGKFTGSTVGSKFTGLTVANIPVPVTTPANTKIVIPLFGYVVINEQVIPKPAAGIGGTTSTTGLRVVITQTNVLSLPVGAEIVVAFARASAAPN